MGKPGNKNQSAISNIFKRVPNYNYEKQGTEAIVPGIGGMGANAAEDSFMGEGKNSPLQLSEAQEGLDENNNGRIDAEDLAIKRSKK
tara:strand:- start:1182 stop:1442 length:261 start_codon:yes stop_codon:yes gene_type:complete